MSWLALIFAPQFGHSNRVIDFRSAVSVGTFAPISHINNLAHLPQSIQSAHMDITSNVNELEAEFLAAFDEFGFDTVTSSGETVGEQVAQTVAEMIHASDAVGPGGTPWPENREPYRGEKRRKYGSDTTGFRTGQMLSVKSLYGEPQIGGDEMTRVYGTGQPPTHGEDGLGFDAEADGEVTDREKAEYFTENVGEFYSLNEEREAAVGEIVRDAFAGHAQQKFGG